MSTDYMLQGSFGRTPVVEERRTINIAPDVEGMKHWLAAVARDTDERALWGVHMADALGILEWYSEALGEARGWTGYPLSA